MIRHTLLAYLLALTDYSESLSSKDRDNLHHFAKEFHTYPDEWEDYLEPLLVKKIAENPQLNQSFQSYKNKLDQLKEIPLDLLPKLDNFNELEKILSSNSRLSRDPELPNLLNNKIPEGQEEILNNSAFLISGSKEPEITVKNVKWIDKLKKWLG